MNFSFKKDCHNHTKFCNHAKGKMEEYVFKAIKKGIKSFCFLEHLESGINLSKRLWMNEEDIPIYFNICNNLKEKFKEKIEIKCGVELGFNPFAVSELMKKIEEYPFDPIGLSLHYKYIPQLKRWINLVSVKNFDTDIFKFMTDDEITLDYINTLITALDFFTPDFICHLNAISKNIKFNLENKEIEKSLKFLFKKMKQKNIDLEINLSGFDYTGEPFPNYKIIKMAKSFDLKFVLGSDSHSPEEVGKNFEKFKKYMENKKTN